MKLHVFDDDFSTLISLVAHQMNLPEAAIEMDYYIVCLLQNLAKSVYSTKCVFKGGTSLSKCYPGSIERFSEDIDLTYLGEPDLSDAAYSKRIKEIERIITKDANTEKIANERSNRSKSMYVWFNNKDRKIKLEIGSSIRPDPYAEKTIKSYIHEFLERQGAAEEIAAYELEAVTLNVLDITRTFIDKIMSVKRHAIERSLPQKVRHIYDVVRLYEMPEIRSLLNDSTELKKLVLMTKETDSFYFEKRHIDVLYDPLNAYDFTKWAAAFDGEVRAAYEKLHLALLYTDEKQDFQKAVQTFSAISDTLAHIGE